MTCEYMVVMHLALACLSRVVVYRNGRGSLALRACINIGLRFVFWRVLCGVLYLYEHADAGSQSR